MFISENKIANNRNSTDAKGASVARFETTAMADNTASEIVVYEVDAVDETDVKPLNGNLTTNRFKYKAYYPIMRIANYTDATQSVRVIAAEYDADGILNNVNISNSVDVKSGDYIRYGGKLNGENRITAKDNTATIKVFVWDSVAGMKPIAKTPATVIKNY